MCKEPYFNNNISISNDSSETPAHPPILYGYMSLSRQLVEWRIDLTVADISGLIALRCAYLKWDRGSIRIFREGRPSSL